eukprot:NODE_115_length_18417_cov_0.666012.p1 type:complete len:1040 gc:universal NODE_115_length_18417_cov_0.666012:1050-4169(+)
MKLLHKTIVPSTYVRDICTGSFTKPKEQEMVTIGGSLLRLFSLTNGKLILLQEFDLLCTLCTVNAVKLPGTHLDLICLTSDGGLFHVFKLENCQLLKIHAEAFGRSGTRRIIPGIYTSVDPKGRAIMTSAIESKKITYILNRDDSKYLISSPLEINSNKTIVFDSCGVDVGFDNPVFAVLECQYDDATRNSDWYNFLEKQVVFYELDLGLNTMILKFSHKVDSQSHKVIQVPSGLGPSGVLVFAINSVTWVHPKNEPITAPYPQRDLDANVMVNCVTLFKSKKQFFYILQFNNGDVFKLEFKEEFQFYYLATMKVCSQIAVFKSGFIYFANNSLYQIENLGESTSTEYEAKQTGSLSIAQNMINLTPLLHISKFKESLFALTGTHDESKYSLIKHGSMPTVIQSIPLPDIPKKMFSFLLNSLNYIAISFIEYTIILEFGQTINQKQLDCCKYASVSIGTFKHEIFQVTNDFIMYKNRNIFEAPIKLASHNEKQLLVYSQKSVILFELNINDDLHEVMNLSLENVVDISIPPLKNANTLFFVVLFDREIHIYNFNGEMLSMTMLGYSAVNCEIYLSKNTYALNVSMTSGHCFHANCNESGDLYNLNTKYISHTVKCHDQLIIADDIWVDDTNIILKDQIDAIYLNDMLFSVDSKSFVYCSINLQDKMNIKTANLPNTPKICLDYQNQKLLLCSDNFQPFDGSWQSTAFLLSDDLKALHLFDLNETPLSACFCILKDEKYLAVSTAVQLKSVAFAFHKSYIKLFDSNFELVHTTELKDLCHALHPFHEFLMAGVHNKVVLYDAGKKQLLKKSEVGNVNEKIIKIHSQGNRIFVSDLNTGYAVLEYLEGEFIRFCDDYLPRHPSASYLLDYDTLISGDKFGLISTLRVPDRLRDDLQQDMYANRILYQRGFLNGAPHRLEKVNEFFVNDLVTHFSKTTSAYGPIILASGIHGSVIGLIPIQLKSEFKVLEPLEDQMRILMNTMNRSHLAYRSSYGACKDVIDFDLLIQFLDLDATTQNKLAETIELTVSEICTIIYKFKSIN